MLHSLRGRITLSYVAFVMILFLAVAAVLARGAVQLYAKSANDTIETAANQIRQIVAANPNASLPTLTAQVHRTVDRPGLRIVVFSERREPPSPPPPPPARDSTSRIFFAISNLAGIRPERIETKSASFFVGFDPNRLRALLTSYALLALAGLIVFGAIGFAIGRYLAAQALAPMVAVTGALQRFARGDFTPQRIDTQDRTEVGELAQAFNGAAAQVTAAFDERRRVEEYIRQFVADASHELRTPLTVIRGYLDVLRRGALADPQRRERAFATMDIESNRMRALIDKLILLARLERPEPSEVARIDLATVTRSLVEAALEIPGHPPISLDADDGVHVLAEESELHEAVANLLDNARKYGAGAPVRVEVKRADPFVVARVIDEGPGIPEAEQPHVFDRFYRGESRGEIQGSGLGLSIAAQAVSRAHGTLRLVESRPGRTVFEIKLPAAPSQPASPTELVLG